MKKWNEPQLVELSLENTKDSECNMNFGSEFTTQSLGPVFCNKNAYERTSKWNPICKHFKNLKCTYVAPIKQS